MRNILNRSLSMIILIAVVLTMCNISAFAMGTQTYYTTGKCYFRVAPDKNSKKICSISKGVKLEADHNETDNRGVEWANVYYKGQWGYVSLKNLSTKAPSSKKPTYKKYVWITGSCNLRSEPSLNGSKKGSAHEGEYFTCTDAAKDDRGVVWYKIKHSKKGSVWVSSKYATTHNSKPDSQTTKKPVATATPKPIDYSKFTACEYYVRVTATSLNLRYEPSADSSKIGVYYYGDVLYAMRTNGDWYQILDESSNRSGYVSAAWTERVEETEEQNTESEAVTESVVNSYEELEACVPNAVLPSIPEEATNIEYSWHYIGTKDVTVAQIAFDYQGIRYTLRAAPCADESQMIDIDDPSVEMSPEIEENASLHISFSTDNTIAAAHYFSSTYTTQYSLSGPAAGNGVVVLSLANQLIEQDVATQEAIEEAQQLTLETPAPAA